MATFGQILPIGEKMSVFTKLWRNVTMYVKRYAVMSSRWKLFDADKGPLDFDDPPT